MAVCGLGSAGGVSTAGFFPRHWSLPTSLHSFPKGCHLCPQQPGHTEVPGILPAHGRALSTRHLHTGVSSSSRGPCAHPAASQLPGKLILHWKISVHLPPPPPHFRNVPLSTKLLPGKVSEAGIFCPRVEKPPGRHHQPAFRAGQWWDLRRPVSNADLRPELPIRLTLWLRS